MNLHRIYAIILRHVFLFRHSLDRVVDVFYWPAIDLITWGLTGTYINSTSNDPTLKAAMVTGLILWTFIWRGQYEISINILEELWNKNLVNIFVTPITFAEWLKATMLIGVIKAFISFFYLAILSLIVFNVSIFNLIGWYLLLFIPILLMTGWWLGFFITGTILRFGTRVQTFAWTLVWLIAPLSAIYFPIATLPSWSQNISIFNPARYIFENARLLIKTGQIDWNWILIALSINIILLSITYLYLKSSYNKLLKRKGLIKFY
jgi:ABC-2 type transport system permease protein